MPGFGAALATTRLVASFLYGLQPNDPWTLGIAAAMLAMAAAIAGYLPYVKVSLRSQECERGTHECVRHGTGSASVSTP